MVRIASTLLVPAAAHAIVIRITVAPTYLHNCNGTCEFIFNCTFFLAHEDQEAMKQVEQWSEELNIPVINNRISITYGLEKIGTFDAEVLCKK